MYYNVHKQHIVIDNNVRYTVTIYFTEMCYNVLSLSRKYAIIVTATRNNESS
jgi:hypothetical protein